MQGPLPIILHWQASPDPHPHWPPRPLAHGPPHTRASPTAVPRRVPADPSPTYRSRSLACSLTHYHWPFACTPRYTEHTPGTLITLHRPRRMPPLPMYRPLPPKSASALGTSPGQPGAPAVPSPNPPAGPRPGSSPSTHPKQGPPLRAPRLSCGTRHSAPRSAPYALAGRSLISANLESVLDAPKPIQHFHTTVGYSHSMPAGTGPRHN